MSFCPYFHYVNNEKVNDHFLSVKVRERSEEKMNKLGFRELLI